MALNTAQLEKRKLMLGALGVGVALPAAAAVPGQPDVTYQAARPRQGWMSRDGRLQISANGASAISDPVSYLQIHEAFSRYAIAHDEANLPVFGSMFTDEAVLEVGIGQGAPIQTLTGRDAILAHLARVLAAEQDQRRHCFSNILIESLGATEATAYAYLLVSAASDSLVFSSAGVYAVALRREAVGGPWRFSHVFIGIDQTINRRLPRD